ncbi:MAG: stage II sporulation protein M [Candidatus Altiarchaeota archaeon]
MVLESIVVPERWLHHPMRMLVIGLVYSLLGIMLGILLFGRYASVAGIFLTTIPLVVIWYHAIYDEERKSMEKSTEHMHLAQYKHILWFFIFLFVGMVFAYSLWFTFMPLALVTVSTAIQIDTIYSIQNQFAATGASTLDTNDLVVILLNNLRVLLFCIIFSFVYGAGAIFILSWNASVIGVAIGNMGREGLARLGQLGQSPSIMTYFSVLPVSISYLIHGLPEVVSYFFGILAGGIISEAVVCHHYREPEFWRVIKDSSSLILVSLMILLLAALIEVYVTPVLFDPLKAIT